MQQGLQMDVELIMRSRIHSLAQQKMGEPTFLCIYKLLYIYITVRAESASDNKILNAGIHGTC